MFVAEMGKTDAVVTIDCFVTPCPNQHLCILLVWKRAERSEKYHNVGLGAVF